VVDDKLDLPGGGAHDLPDVAERRAVEVEHRHTDEITDAHRLWKALQIALLHRHRILCVHHAGPRYHGLSARRERPCNHCTAEHCDELTSSHPALPKAQERLKISTLEVVGCEFRHRSLSGGL